MKVRIYEVLVGEKMAAEEKQGRTEYADHNKSQIRNCRMMDILVVVNRVRT